jgi:hypothetical protein
VPRHGIGDGTRQHKVAFTVRICQLESTIPPIKGTKRTLSLQLYCMLHYVVQYGDLGNAIRSFSVNEELLSEFSAMLITSPAYCISAHGNLAFATASWCLKHILPSEAPTEFFGDTQVLHWDQLDQILSRRRPCGCKCP